MQKMQSIGMETSLELSTATAAAVAAIVIDHFKFRTKEYANNTTHEAFVWEETVASLLCLAFKMLIKISSESQCLVAWDT